jgi:predicted phosphodiesterase
MSRLYKRTFLSDNTSHYDWMEKNSPKYTKAQMAEILGRTVDSIDRKLRREGWQCLDDNVIQVGNDDVEEEIEGIPKESLLQFMKNTPRSFEDLSEKFNKSINTIRKALEQLQVQHFAITQTEAEHFVWSTKTPPHIVAPPTILWDKDVWEFKLGAMSDWHDGSKAAQISARNRAIKIMYDEGVRDIIVAGDINAGCKVYKGQEFDVVTMRYDEQAAITEAYCPQYEGLRYHIMGGNHDYDAIKNGAHNALDELCDRRDDFWYYGYDLVTVRLTEDVDALVWHPSGSSAYAMSYKSQKMVEQLAFEQLMEVIKKNATPKVRFVFVGHWHNIFMWYEKGPINVVHTGGLEGQTNLTRRIGNIAPHISAWIISGEITKDRNLIRRLKLEPMNFTEIEDDYLNYAVPQRKRELPPPLFQWDGEYPDGQ